VEESSPGRGSAASTAKRPPERECLWVPAAAGAGRTAGPAGRRGGRRSSLRCFRRQRPDNRGSRKSSMARSPRWTLSAGTLRPSAAPSMSSLASATGPSRLHEPSHSGRVQWLLVVFATGLCTRSAMTGAV